MKRIILFAAIFMSLILQSASCNKNSECSKGSHNGLIISNKSDRIINYEINWNYSDTMIAEYNPLHDGTNGLAPGKNSTRGAGPNNCWESQLSRGKKVWLFFFDQDSLKAISWETVRATERGMLERRLIDLEYLRIHDFRITYPE